MPWYNSGFSNLSLDMMKNPNHPENKYVNNGSTSEPRTALGLVSAGISLAGLAYNVYANERARSDQNKLNKQAQSNFENQFQIAARDLQKAGFNPSAILGGASQNSAPSMSGYSPNQLDLGSISSMMDSITNAKLAESQVQKNQAETKNIENLFTHEKEISELDAMLQDTVNANSAKRTLALHHYDHLLDLLKDKNQNAYDFAKTQYTTIMQSSIEEFRQKMENEREKLKQYSESARTAYVQNTLKDIVKKQLDNAITITGMNIDAELKKVMIHEVSANIQTLETNLFNLSPTSSGSKFPMGFLSNK